MHGMDKCDAVTLPYSVGYMFIASLLSKLSLMYRLVWSPSPGGR